MGETPNQMSKDAPEVKAIKADIEETRAEMAETIVEIEERLNPRNLAQQAKESIKDATVGRIGAMMNSASEKARDLAGEGREMAGGMTQRMKDSPVPYVLIGLGVGWLVLKGRGNGAPVTYRRDQSYDRGYGRRAYPGAEGWEDEQSWSEAAGHAASRTRERLSEYGSRAQSSVDRWVHENPLALGVAAFAVGAALGLSIPETEVEHEWMGETRDSLVDKAQQMTSDAVETIQDTISGTSSSS